MKPFYFPIGFNSLDAATAFYNQPDFIWLDSNKPDHPQSRYSYIVFQSSLLKPSSLRGGSLDGGEDFPPFIGGYVGFKSYEGEDHFKFYDRVLSFDHLTGQGWFVIWSESEFQAHQAYETICKAVRNARPIASFEPSSIEWVSNFSEGDYKNAVHDIVSRILNGDIFQANLTHQFFAPKPEHFNAFVHYLHLREVNPAPFSAFINFGDFQISSASPESFLSLTKDGFISTRPIKGTDRDADKLLSSTKDKAENVMIVDLLRNDLSQICEDASVVVDKLCELQSFAGLHHLVSVVSGKLRPNIGVMDALNACFPGGSITGAPKIAAMNILRQIEKIPRGIYCGSIGWMGIDGAMEMNIAIRTVMVTKDKLSFGVGGGITALSDPGAEYQETLLKADRIFKSFGGGAL